MKRFLFFLILPFLSCKSNPKPLQKPGFTEVAIETVYEDSINIRAIEIREDKVIFAGNKGQHGFYDISRDEIVLKPQEYGQFLPEFRAVASTSSDIFVLSVANPALLYKIGEDGKKILVYKEENEKVFYDSMTFWNDKEGIAMGDPVDNCLSIIVTRDGGGSWQKLSCEQLPETIEGEAGFAASDSNIAVVGDNTWIISGGMISRVFYSPDRGLSWEVFDTPLVSGKTTTGAYSVHFFDEKNGIIIGGDYTAPENNFANIARTSDGGRTWELVADGQNPGYKSSIRYVPNAQAEEIVAVGFTGISYSSDRGETWNDLSQESFYTIRFVNDSTAYAAGKNRLARIVFK